tara:strand:- start:4642 stop:5640 length:999 start_codon:yes stop_codon:yes gene_type:complete
MFARYVVSILLIGIGIASPWLVRDWLEWRADREAPGLFYRKLADFPDSLRAKLGGAGPPLFAAASSVASSPEHRDSKAGSAEPYPFASKTMKIIQGFLPATAAIATGSGLPIPRLGYDAAMVSVQDAEVDLGSGLSSLGLEAGDPIFLRIFKEEDELELWMQADGDSHYTLFKVYRLEGWSGGLGPKLSEGDRQTPEGFYHVGASRLRPETRHHLGIDLGFPNEYDRFHGRSGSELMIHGGRSDSGAFVVSGDDMSEVFALAESALKGGQELFRVNVFPFRMSDRRMNEEWEEQPEWIDFWVNLKEGYDFFENANFPPDVAVSAGKYGFRFP